MSARETYARRLRVDLGKGRVGHPTGLVSRLLRGEAPSPPPPRYGEDVERSRSRLLVESLRYALKPETDPEILRLALAFFADEFGVREGRR